MSLYTHRATDMLPTIQSPAGLTIVESTDMDLLARLGSTSIVDVEKRLENDHVAFVSYINDVPAGFGWMARRKATIGELAHELSLPVGNRYLWNFRTLEAFRGLGIYPILLQYIIKWERGNASRFWIIHAPENTSSLKGINKAGFHYVGKLYTNDRVATIENTPQSKRAQKLLAEMKIFLSGEEPASCWNCSSPHLKKRKLECCCVQAKEVCVGNNLLSLAP